MTPTKKPLKTREATTPKDCSPRTRQCIATREVLPEARMVRFVADPQGCIVPDLAAKLPGRGMWVSATRQAVSKTATRGLFARAAKMNVSAAPDLADDVEAALGARIKSSLGLAARAGALVCGFELVRDALKSGRVGLLIEAKDGAEDGRKKILALAHGVGVHAPVLGCFSGQELDLALGRSNVIHAAVQGGPLADKLGLDMSRLAGFKELASENWRLPGGSVGGALHSDVA